MIWRRQWKALSKETKEASVYQEDIEEKENEFQEDG
jgi:hypothetical protein